MLLCMAIRHHESPASTLPIVRQADETTATPSAPLAPIEQASTADISLTTDSDTSRPPSLSPPSPLPAPEASSEYHTSAICLPQDDRFGQTDTTHTTTLSV